MGWKRCPEDYEPNGLSMKFCKSKGLSDEMIADEVFAMKDHEYKVAHSDPDATFRNWIRKRIEWGHITLPRKPRSVEAVTDEEYKTDADKAVAQMDAYRRKR